MTTSILSAALPREPRPLPTWVIFCAAAIMAMLFSAALNAILFYGWPVKLQQGAGSPPGIWILVTSILMQPLTLALRVALVALLAQAFLLVAGESTSFRLLFRCALIASFAMLVQLFLTLVPIFQHHDLTHLDLVPGTLNAVLPGLAASPIWGPLGRILSVLEIAWLALLYLALRRGSQVSAGKAALAVGGTWLLSILVGWALGLMPHLLGLTQATT